MGRNGAALTTSTARQPPSRAFGWVAAAALPTAFITIFFVYPVSTMLWRGVGAVGEALGNPSIRGVLWFTVAQAAASTVLTLAVGMGGAAMLARLRPRSRRIVRAAVTVPFVLPTVVVAGAFNATFTRLGLYGDGFTLRHSVWAILAAHVFFNYAVVVRTVGSWWAGIDRRYDDAASVLGASRAATFRHVTWPLLRPSVAVAAVITFLFCFTSFGVILILGGPRRATLETEIFRYAVTRLDFRTAAALAVIQLVAVVAMVAVTNRLERRRAVARRPAGNAAPRRSRAVIGVNAAIAATLLGLPIAALIEQSLRVGDGYGFANFTALTERVSLLAASGIRALVNSLTFATLATVIATTVGVVAAVVATRGERAAKPLARALDVGLTLPLGVSAVVVGFGFLIALDSPPLDLRTSPWLIGVAHALVGLPFVVRTLVPTLRGIDQRLREAAAVLGATPWRVVREIDAPIASRAVVVGAAFAFAVSLGEFGATAFVPRRAETLTAPLAIFRLLGTPGEALRSQAMALSVTLMVAAAASVVVIESLRRTDEAVF